MTHKHIGLACACAFFMACVVQTGSSLPQNQNQQQGNPNEPHPPFSADPSVAELLDFIPSNVAILGGADFEKIRSSEHWAAYKDKLIQELDHEAVGIFRDQCGIDIIEVAGWAVIAVPPERNNDDGTLMVMSSSVTWPELHDCTSRLGFQFEQDGDISIYRHLQETLYLRWLSNNTFMFSANPSGRGLYDAAQRKGAQGTFVSELIKEIDTTAMLWMVADTSKARDHFGGMQNLPGAVGLFGSGELPGSFSARLGVAFDNPQSARSTATQLAQQIDVAKQSMAGPFLQNVQMSVEGNNVMIDAALAKAEVDMLLSMAMQSSF